MLIPKENEKDLEEIPDNVKKGLEIIPVAYVDEVLQNALVTALVPIEWDEEAEAEAESMAQENAGDSDLGGMVTH